MFFVRQRKEERGEARKYKKQKDTKEGTFLSSVQEEGGRLREIERV